MVVVESFHKCFKYMEVVSSYIIHSEMTDIKISHLEFHRQSTTFLLWKKEHLTTHHGPHCHVKKVRISDGHYIVVTF